MNHAASLRAAPLLFAALALLAAFAAFAQVAVPPLTARVTDLTQTLNAAERAELEKTLAQFEARKGAQIAVLIVPTTAPETVEQYGVRVEESWKLGRKGVDDGALLLVAKGDRTVRIEVGYGLEGVMPDVVAKRIIEEKIVPRFKAGDFFGGLRDGIAVMIKVIDGEPLPAPKAAAPQIDPATVLTLGFFVVVFLGGVLRALFGRALGAGIVGALAGAAVWLLTGAAFIGVLAGAAAFVLSLVRESSFCAGRGGWSSRGGWGGGGGFGGGGFGGGGGSSGGGGASGRW